MAVPVGADDPAAAMATYHGLILQLKEDMRLPSATALDPVLNALGPAVVPFFGDDAETLRLRGQQRSRRRPDEGIFAGARVARPLPLRSSHGHRGQLHACGL